MEAHILIGQFGQPAYDKEQIVKKCNKKIKKSNIIANYYEQLYTSLVKMQIEVGRIQERLSKITDKQLSKLGDLYAKLVKEVIGEDGLADEFTKLREDTEFNYEGKTIYELMLDRYVEAYSYMKYYEEMKQVPMYEEVYSMDDTLPKYITNQIYQMKSLYNSIIIKANVVFAHL